MILYRRKKEDPREKKIPLRLEKEINLKKVKENIVDIGFYQKINDIIYS